MTDRERWIVYPLLFLALGASLRDKLMKRSVTDHLICKQVSVVDENYDPVARLEVLTPTDGTAPVARLAVSGQIAAKEVLADNLERQRVKERSNWSMLSELLRRMGVAVRAAPAKTQPPQVAEKPLAGETDPPPAEP